ncbi:siderophore-interacting protein [Sagittula sp. SSi028]|uniref:siderophore-interacting protein n=1 Tax=Sagittula sp. SSi028 TaxID=3400636 RepID=UPI003AF84D35
MSETIAKAMIHGLPFALMRQAALAQAQEHDMPVVFDDARGTAVQTYYGRVCFAPAEDGLQAEITAPHADYLQVLKDALVDQIGAQHPQLAETIRWNDATTTAQRPANIVDLTVTDRAHLNCGFIRITLAGDVSRFSDEAIHFRLCLPPEGRDPVWPTLGPNGATQWPKGENKLHLPVYTARHVDPAAGTVSFDVMEHDGGCATRWARQVAMGVQVLTTAPGGGGCRMSGQIAGFGDETAYPAVARILEANPDLTGSFTLYPSKPGPLYPLPDHPRVKVTFAEAGAQAQMAEQAIAAMTATPQAYLWCAGERRIVADVRAASKAMGRPAAQSYITAFW